MTERELLRPRIAAVFDEIQYLIRLLYATTDYHAQNLTLNQLWNQVALLQFLVGLLEREAAVPAPPQRLPEGYPALTVPAGPALPRELPTVSRAELAAATGRRGNPAYVAVNGIVYDVTNHRAWSAATHFGLPAGKDLTAEFASCHAGQQWILGTMRPVGRLA